MEIKIPLETLESLDIKTLESVMQRHKGNQTLRFRFSDAEEQMEADGFSRKMTVNPSNEFLHDMKEELGLDVTLL
jgi:hypothetical protein